MRISDLNCVLTNVANFLPRLKGGQAAQSLESVCEALRPWSEMSLEEFASFLRASEEYRRTGKVVEVRKGGARAKAARPVDQAAVAEAVARLQALYDTATTDETTHDVIAKEVAKIGKDFLTAGVYAVAKGFGLAGKFTKKMDAIQAIKSRIADRRTMYTRTHM